MTNIVTSMIAATCLATNMTPVETYWTYEMAAETITNRAQQVNETEQDQVERLAKSGAICKRFGCRFDGAFGNESMFITTYPMQHVARRTCAVCGKTQVKNPSEWVDEKQETEQ